MPKFDKVAVLGHAVWLMSQSAAHKHMLISDLEWLVMPPVALGQFRLWHEKTMPIAFATWAFLGEEQEQRLLAAQTAAAAGKATDIGQLRMRPMDWKSGDKLWLIDLIAPYGGAEEAMKELREQVFGGRELQAIQPTINQLKKQAIT